MRSAPWPGEMGQAVNVVNGHPAYTNDVQAHRKLLVRFRSRIYRVYLRLLYQMLCKKVQHHLGVLTQV
jgi:hypothetical protein